MALKIFEFSTMFNLRTVLLLCLMAGGTLAAGADCPSQEFSRTINREFNTTADGMTALYNKYGTVNVKTWQNNAVKIDITIVVNAGSQREADKIFDRIKVNFANAVGYVKAETMIENYKAKAAILERVLDRLESTKTETKNSDSDNGTKNI